MARDVRKRMAQEIDKIPLFPGVSEMLQALVDQGLMLAVVSSNSEANVRAVLGPQNTAHFTLFNCGASVFGKAPKLKSVMKKCRVSPETVILIGDEIRDLKSARDAQISFGAVTWGYTAESSLREHSPEEIFDHPQQILSAVRSGPSPHFPDPRPHPGKDAAG